jgi:hypothetical protein
MVIKKSQEAEIFHENNLFTKEADQKTKGHRPQKNLPVRYNFNSTIVKTIQTNKSSFSVLYGSHNLNEFHFSCS